MTSDEKFEHCLDIAQYDLDTSEAMFQSERWLYVAFMCQQVTEKLSKALYILHVDDNPPRSHNINSIFGKYSAALQREPSENLLNLFDKLTAYYLSGRYPEYKEKLSNSIDGETASRLLADTKEAFKWLLTMKP